MSETPLEEVIEDWKPIKVRIVGSKGGHAFRVGSTVTITKVVPNESNTPYYARNIHGDTYYLHKDDFERIKLVRSHLNTKLTDLFTEVSKLERKLEYLDATDQDEADESEYKIHQAITIIKNESDETEQTKMIANLMGE